MIIIPDRIKGTTFITKAESRNNKFLHIGINPEYAHIYGAKKENIVDVKCTIIDDDIICENLYKDKTYDIKSIDYFGWVKQDDDTKEWEISMIYGCLTGYHMCFPGGADIERIYNIDITDINNSFNIIHHKGDRRGYTVRLKIEQI